MDSFKSFVSMNSLGSNDRGFTPNLTTQLLAEEAHKLVRDLPDSSRVLDLGCGQGWIGMWIKAQFPHLYVACADSHAPSVESARKLRHKLSLDVDVFHSDLYSNLLGEKYDLIVCDVSGVSKDVSEMSGWFESADPPLDIDGIKLLFDGINDSTAWLRYGGCIIAPFLSVSNLGKLTTKIQNKFNYVLLSSKDWPAPSWAYEPANSEKLSKLEMDKVISFKNKFGVTIFNTSIYRISPKIYFNS